LPVSALPVCPVKPILQPPVHWPDGNYIKLGRGLVQSCDLFFVQRSLWFLCQALFVKNLRATGYALANQWVDTRTRKATWRTAISQTRCATHAPNRFRGLWKD
jgi:hypothetical protein